MCFYFYYKLFYFYIRFEITLKKITIEIKIAINESFNVKSSLSKKVQNSIPRV